MKIKTGGYIAICVFAALFIVATLIAACKLPFTYKSMVIGVDDKSIVAEVQGKMRCIPISEDDSYAIGEKITITLVNGKVTNIERRD